MSGGSKPNSVCGSFEKMTIAAPDRARSASCDRSKSGNGFSPRFSPRGSGPTEEHNAEPVAKQIGFRKPAPSVDTARSSEESLNINIDLTLPVDETQGGAQRRISLLAVNVNQTSDGYFTPLASPRANENKSGNEMDPLELPFGSLDGTYQNVTSKHGKKIVWLSKIKGNIMEYKVAYCPRWKSVELIVSDHEGRNTMKAVDRGTGNARQFLKSCFVNQGEDKPNTLLWQDAKNLRTYEWERVE